MPVHKLWIISIVISILILALPAGMTLPLLPLLAFLIPLSESELWHTPARTEGGAEVI